jgi:alpha-galactosidase/6-phospho-beta-glucosidase family protein
MAPRVVVVGGGSYHWAPSILMDFANTRALTDTDVVLHDLDHDRATRMAALGTEIARRREIALTVRAEPDRRKALADADFVVTSFSVGGFDSMRHDLEIPERYGIVQPIGDSVGPGGVSRALRSVPVLLDIARDVEDVAPQALLLNVTNPLTALCRAVTRETGCRTVGLCNEWVSTTFVLSLLFDCGMHEIDATLAGVNHFPLALDLTVTGEDAFAMLRALLDDPDRAAREGLWMDPPEQMVWEKAGGQWTKADVLAHNRVRMELFRRFGMLVCSGDHHSTEFVPGFVHADNGRGSGWNVHVYRLAKHMADAEADVARYDALVAAADVPAIPSGELVAPLVEAVVTGKARSLPVNLPNAGNVTNLPDSAVVEIMGVVDATGVRGRDHATVPGVMGEWLRRVQTSQELTVEAALTGDRTLALEAMLTDPMCSALAFDDVVTMTDELLTATAPWLPQFAAR